MTHFLTRLARKALLRIGAGILLGLGATALYPVASQSAQSLKLPNPMSALTGSNEQAVSRPQSAKPAPGRMLRNVARIDKGDSDDYFTEASVDRKFDPCKYFDGREYIGPGTVLNPHEDFTGCLPQVALEDDAFLNTGVFDVAGGGAAAGTATENGDVLTMTDTAFFGGGVTNGGTETVALDYLDVFGPGSPFGDLVPGTGVSFAQIVTGGGGSTGSTGFTSVPFTANPVPLPAPAVLFLMGIAGVVGLRKRAARA